MTKREKRAVFYRLHFLERALGVLICRSFCLDAPLLIELIKTFEKSCLSFWRLLELKENIGYSTFRL
jgi:hypothetical protein